jgi:hypothetical protein
MKRKDVNDHSWMVIGEDGDGNEIVTCVDCGITYDYWLEDPKECV